MSQIKIVAVDSGKHRTKAVLLENSEVVKRFGINTKASEYDELKSLSPSSFAVTIGDKTLLVGDQSALFSSKTSKALDLHRYATLLAVSKLVKNGDTVALAIGCPINLYLDSESRENYLRFMAGIPSQSTEKVDFKNLNREISFLVDGEKFSFTLAKLFVAPESSGFLIKYEQKYLGRNIAIVDIGGLNVNGAIYQNVSINQDGEEIEYLQMLDTSTFTLNDGGNIFSTKLMDALNSKYDVGISINQMRHIIQEGSIKIDREGSRRLIEREKRQFFEKIKQQMESRRWSIKTLDFIFVGGGSLLFKDDILNVDEFSDAFISSSAEYDNVEGFAFLVEDALSLELETI